MPRKVERTRHTLKWTDEELAYLQDNWGNVSLDTLARRLQRTKVAVYGRAKKLKLGPALAAAGAYTTTELAEMLGVADSTVYKWVQSGEMKAHKFSRENGRYAYRIYDYNFLKWAEKNQSRFTTNNLPDYIFGDEPQWLKDKRKFDLKNPNATVRSWWTIKEEKKLISMVNSGMYSRQDLANYFKRGVKAVNSKILRLINEGKVKAESKEEREKRKQQRAITIDPSDLERTPEGFWKDSAKMKMAELYETGDYTYAEVGEFFNCGGSAVRSIIRKLREDGMSVTSRRKTYKIFSHS